MPRRTFALVPLLASALLTGCGGRVAPPVAPAPAPAEAPFPYADVWTRHGGVVLQRDSAGVTLPYASMRLQVLRVDSADLLLVRCIVCPVPVDGRVRRGEVLYEPRSPSAAATDSLAEFVLAIREAARRHDVPALRAVMAPGFVHATDGPDGVLSAVHAWEDMAFRTLDRVPGLLDRGVAPVPEAELWAAPPAFVTQTGYQQLRAGFRRVGGRWQWVFLVQGAAQ